MFKRLNKYQRKVIYKINKNEKLTNLTDNAQQT